MSDYDAGRRGDPFAPRMDESEFQRGLRDRSAADADASVPRGPGPGYDVAAAAGEQWARTPGKHLFKLLLELIIWPAILAAIAFAAVTFIGPEKLGRDVTALGAAVNVGKFVLWFLALVGWSQLLGATLGARRFHVPTILMWFILSGYLVYGLKVAVLDQMG